MKTSLLVLLCYALMNSIQAQTINDIPLEKMENQFIKIVGTQDENDIYIDFGSEYNAPRYNSRIAAPEYRNMIKSKEGHEIIFSSMIDALNFLAKNGFSFVQAYTVSSGTSSSTRYYLLERKT